MLSAMPSRRQSSAIEVSPRRPSSTMRIFSSAAWCFRVARRMLRTSVSDDAGVELDLRSLRATMSQKSPVPQAVSFVSQVLKRDRMRDAAHVPELEKDAASGSMDRVGYPPPASNLFRTVNTWRARITPALLRNLRA